MIPPRLAITPGEPAGIGPDLLIEAAARPWPAELVAIGSARLLRERARKLGKSVELRKFSSDEPPRPHEPGVIRIMDTPLTAPVNPGELDPANAAYVLGTLERATNLCLNGIFSGMVTAPVHKAVINDAGINFSGHTEFLAARSGVNRVVMMLASKKLRVALATTHLPLREVAGAITPDLLSTTLTILHGELRERFRVDQPCILVCGLNPHAGEGGYLGREELDVINPVLDTLREQGMNLEGPLPADSLFTPGNLERADAVLAMYHDQGLGPLKALSFGQAVNITLGLPFVRTSVDHGTALSLAGTGRGDASSLIAAIDLAVWLCSSPHD